MTTERRGPLFLSYRRTRAEDMAVLVPVLHEMGVPTWQDVTELREDQTEEALEGILDGPAISGGLIWLTRDVWDSRIVRSLEIPRLFKRAKTGDGFVLLPLLAGGLDYNQVREVVPATDLIDDPRTWNLKRVPPKLDGVATGPPLAIAAAQRIASLALHRRLVAVVEHRGPSDALLIGVCARGAAPRVNSTDLLLHWDHHFRGRHAAPHAWATRMLPALATLRSSIQTCASGRRVIFEGLMPLAGAFALGHAFVQPLGILTAWRQRFPNGDAQEWSLATSPEPVPIKVELTRLSVEATELAILVAAGGAVGPAFRASHSALPAFRAVLSIEVDAAHLPLASSASAVGLAKAIVELAKSARASLSASGAVHFFIAGPAGLAFLLGQLCNQLMPAQTYEYDAEGNPPYVAAARICLCDPIRPLTGSE